MLNKIKKCNVLIIILLFFLIVSPILAVNTYTTDLEVSSYQYWSITDGDQTGLDLSTDFTIMFWAKRESSGAGQMVSKASGASDRAYEIALYNNGGDEGELCMTVSQDGTYNVGKRHRERTDTQVLIAGTWVHVAVTYDASADDATFYTNSVVEPSTVLATISSPTTIHNSSLYLGIGHQVNDYYDGLIDEVRIFNKILTEEEIGTIYNCQGSSITDGLVAEWSFNNDGLDNTDNNNDLTNNNSATFQSGSFPFSDDCAGAPTDTCTYSSGDWHILESDNCYITSDVYVDGKFNLIGSATGQFGCASGVKVSAENFNFGTDKTTFDMKCFAHH